MPVLLDPLERRILGNESAQLVELLNRWPSAEEAPDFAPDDLQAPIAAWQNLLQPAVNDGVYRCGFARNQAAYDRAENALFAALEQVEHSLHSLGPWLCGERLTLADLRLFPTLIRWETVYSPCSAAAADSSGSFPGSGNGGSTCSPCPECRPAAMPRLGDTTTSEPCSPSIPAGSFRLAQT